MTIVRCTGIFIVLALLFASGCSSGLTGYKLHDEILENNVGAASQLIQSGSDLDKRNVYGETPLQLAIKGRHSDLAIELIEAGVDIDARTKEGASPLILAVMYGELEVARSLIDHGAKLQALGRGKSALFEAIKRNDIELVSVLLEKGSDVNYVDFNGETSLFYAAAIGNIEIARLLIEFGADLNARSSDSRTPLHNAALQGHRDMTNLLFDSGALLSVADNSDVGLLSSAAIYHFSGYRNLDSGYSGRALSDFEEALGFYSETKSLLNAQIDDLNDEIAQKFAKSALSLVATAAFSVAAAGKGSTVMTPDGSMVNTIMVPVPIWNAPDTFDAKQLRQQYRERLEDCEKAIEELSLLVSCLQRDEGKDAC